MSRSQIYKEGEAAASQQTQSNRRSKVTSERVALLVLSVLLAAAVIVIYRLFFHNFQTEKTLQTLKDEIEVIRKNLTENLSGTKPCSTVQPLKRKIYDSCPKCEGGWKPHGGKCYYFSTSKLTWNQSRAECRCGGGDLVKIDSREEQSFLENKVREKMNYDDDKFWIGLTDSEEEGKWLWVDDSPLNTSLTFWSGKEPDDWKEKGPDGEDCVSMGETHGAPDLKCWFDRPCHMYQSSICEKPAEIGLY